jgi:hypothetical protein
MNLFKKRGESRVLEKVDAIVARVFVFRDIFSVSVFNGALCWRRSSDCVVGEI